MPGPSATPSDSSSQIDSLLKDAASEGEGPSTKKTFDLLNKSLKLNPGPQDDLNLITSQGELIHSDTIGIPYSLDLRYFRFM